MARKKGEGHYTGEDRGDLKPRDRGTHDSIGNPLARVERAAGAKGGYSNPLPRNTDED